MLLFSLVYSYKIIFQLTLFVKSFDVLIREIDLPVGFAAPVKNVFVFLVHPDDMIILLFRVTPPMPAGIREIENLPSEPVDFVLIDVLTEPVDRL